MDRDNAINTYWGSFLNWYKNTEYWKDTDLDPIAESTIDGLFWYWYVKVEKIGKEDE